MVAGKNIFRTSPTVIKRTVYHGITELSWSRFPEIPLYFHLCDSMLLTCCWVCAFAGGGADADDGGRGPQDVPPGSHCAHHEGPQAPQTQPAHSGGQHTFLLFQQCAPSLTSFSSMLSLIKSSWLHRSKNLSPRVKCVLIVFSTLSHYWLQ